MSIEARHVVAVPGGTRLVALMQVHIQAVVEWNSTCLEAACAGI